ncbi:MAG: CHAT domain-containing tetratricopeptide repeat protein [Isosphaeraceae bacterium]
MPPSGSQGHGDIALALEQLGRILEDQEQLDDARRCLLRALTMMEALYPTARYPRGHVLILRVLVDLGVFSENQRQLHEALQFNERALVMRRAIYPQHHPVLAALLNNRAHVLAALGNYEAAEKDYQEALALCQTIYRQNSYPVGHHDLARALANLGTLALVKGEYARAWPLLSQAQKMQDNLNELFVATSSEAEALDYVAISRGMFCRLISCSMHLDDSTDDCYAHVWRHKAMIARLLARRQASLAEQARSNPTASRTLVIVPDGLLTAIPWAALPGEQPGTFLIEQYALACAPHAPFVLDLLTSRRREPMGQGTFLAVGGMASLGPGVFGELETVASLARPRRVIELMGGRASVEAVLRALPRARWVHFATHGSFATPEIQSVLQVDPKPFDRLGRKTSAPLARNPLVLSGLLIGAGHGPFDGNVTTRPDDPDILTAEAIAGLPLQGLNLAVLAACETGLGTVAGGESVFGLQRAFHLAGTRTVVASLWSVEDSSTRALMTEFYRNLWTKKLPRLESLRQAQLALIRQYRQRGTGHSTTRPAAPRDAGKDSVADQLPPLFWAGFVLSGDWR